MFPLRYWPLAIPVLFFAVIVAVQPTGRQIPAGGRVPGYLLQGGYSRLITDDSDSSAWVLRAENAARGRLAGRVDEPPEWPKPLTEFDTHETFFGPTYANPPPLSDRYFLEYPPAALYFFRLGFLASGRPTNDESISPALLDGHQYHVAMHAPATPVEERWYAAFRRAQFTYAAILLTVLMATMLLIQRGVGVNGLARGPIWLLVLPGTLYFTPCRFDILPAACVLGCIALTDRKRPLLGAVLLGLAVALKTYPVVLAPLVLRYAVRTWGAAVGWCLAFATLPVLFTLSLYLSDGAEGITGPQKFQLLRTPYPEWAFYGRLFPTMFAFGDWYGQLFRAAPMLLVVGLLTLRRATDAEVLLRRCAVTVILFVSLQVIYSPQWWIWIATLLVPLAGKRRWLVLAVALGEGITYAGFPLLFDLHAFEEIPDSVGTVVREGLVWGRAFLWMAILVKLVLEEETPKPQPEVALQRGSAKPRQESESVTSSLGA